MSNKQATTPKPNNATTGLVVALFSSPVVTSVETVPALAEPINAWATGWAPISVNMPLVSLV
ncbi:hypothetical protein COCCU_00180 [Corynebacterium occultum]|uniref:Uncharacterized protein n=1 Tax=Corynebacterium occultum TaxID=2675219 RepID=A0A6B8W3N2_9CORY|nr:hypothetical protein [Corynebacterium occultum]QGU06005.1 hypothetical protein COCCU_00180 [Corynebacterium occultum]